MSTDKNKKFYEMADAYISLANKQGKEVEMGKVSATFLYAAARFNVFLAASGSNTAEEFASHKKDVIDYYMTEYEKMLEEHFADYQNNFDKYIKG
jgi:hypothetical protein